ncbi:site-specific integrase [Actinokineospora sp. PR83]|uniref:site-specific integrase n=1 Tax=Actinokineospora sp. PR83 TaxID=2884908 RepID=UPI001F28FC8C|nr:site-specific integrase [Actinokineospora sp. PR83]MCG8919240.1 site-specific integrase [Actinokineospora sp. PR83]
MAGKARANGEGSIYPYRNGYAAYVWVDLPGGERKRKYVYGGTRDIVHEKWLKLHQAARENKVTDGKHTVERYLTEWLREVIAPTAAPLTLSTYSGHIRLHILPELGDKRLDRLTTRDVQKWANNLAARCQCCTQGKDQARPEDKRRCCAVGRCCEGRLSARSVSDVRATLRSALSDALAEELVVRNAAAAVKLRAVRKPKRRRWTSDEARRFLESARRDNDPLYAAYVLVLVLGLRRGEALGLPLDSVDFEAAEIDIRYQLQRVDGKLYHRETKTEASDDSLPMPGIVSTALQLRKRRRAEDRVEADITWQECGLMFTTGHGTPIEPRNFNRSWATRVRKAGVPLISSRSARRTCASLLADLDVHPRVAMRILRHAQFTVTMEIYTDASDEATRAALKKLGDSLDG